MNENPWYYHESGQQKGPVSETTLRGLFTDRVIPPSTLVWREGMAEWQPASDALGSGIAPNITPPPVPMTQSSKPTEHSIKKTSVILTIIFTIITVAIYYPCWFLTRRESINALNSREKLGRGVFIFAVVMFSVSLFLSFVIGGLEGLGEGLNNMEFVAISKGVDAIDRIIFTVAAITLLVQCFKVRRILRQHFNEHLGRDVPFSSVALFFLQIYYLQYKINRL